MGELDGGSAAGPVHLGGELSKPGKHPFMHVHLLAMRAPVGIHRPVGDRGQAHTALHADQIAELFLQLHRLLPEEERDRVGLEDHPLVSPLARFFLLVVGPNVDHLHVPLGLVLLGE